MRMIRPYGQSVVANDNKRKIRKNKKDDKSTKENEDNIQEDISSFAENEQKLIISVAISTLDKIILKPKSGKKCPKDIDFIRSNIAQLLWSKLVKKEKVKPHKKYYKSYWDSRVKPYEIGDNNAKFYGRWYRRFCGVNADIKNLNGRFQKIADKIYEHIFANEYRLFVKDEYLESKDDKDGSRRKLGRIENIAVSIEKNTLKKKPENPKLPKVELKCTEKDIRDYCAKQVGKDRKYFILEFKKLYEEQDKKILNEYRDKAKSYYEECAREPDKDKRKCKKPLKKVLEFSSQNVFEAFKENYQYCFKDKDTGAIKPITKLIEENNSEFHAHETVRNYYKTILECYQRKVNKFYELCKEHKGNIPDFSMGDLIPSDTEALIKKLTQKKDNRSVNDDIRLGKIIHYTKLNSTKKDIKESEYWSTDKQIEIKRSEAFIKSWYNFIAFASHSLAYLSDSEKMRKAKQDYKDKNTYFPDPLMMKLKEYDCLDINEFGKRILLVLADNHGFKNSLCDLYEFVRDKLYAIRNSSFHFKGIESLVKTLESTSNTLSNHIEYFYKKDLQKSNENLWEVLKASHIHHYLDDKQITHYWQNLHTKEEADDIFSMPKFRAFLKRAKVKERNFIHPPIAGQEQDASWKCSYELLKRLYEKPFAVWFSKQDKDRNNWITEVKKDIENHQKENSLRTDDDENIWNMLKEFPKEKDFSKYLLELDRLSSQNGSMQSGYASDKKQQRKKANAIECFKMDVLSLGFKKYLEEKDLAYLNNNKMEEKNKEGNKQTFKVPDYQFTIEPWQAELYLLLHFVPVGIVCDLEHQLKKYAVTYMRHQEIQNNKEFTAKEASDKQKETSVGEKNKKDISKILEVFECYRNNHDAKFEGTNEEKLFGEIALFYEKDAKYADVFKDADNVQQKVQHRHLREMVRFGLGNYLFEEGIQKSSIDDEEKRILKKVFPQISQEKIEEYLEQKKSIATKQKERTELHDKWKTWQKENEDKEIKEDFSEKQDYKNVLDEITIFNHLDNHVRLVNYRKIHTLVMQILGRLVGFSFMYERDLYFLTLTYVYKDYLKKLENNLNITSEECLLDFFNKSDARKEKFLDGRIIDVLIHKTSKTPQDIKDKIINPKIMNDQYHKNENHPKNIRNNFAHFNMLRDKNSFNIIDYINQARTLMSYDRKLKNAVAKSMISLCQKENIEIDFKMDGTHTLTLDKIQAFTAYHLKETKNKNPKKKKENNTQENKNKAITEKLHSETYINMVKALFGVTTS